jgi:hypothetical protein
MNVNAKNKIMTAFGVSGGAKVSNTGPLGERL